MKRILLFSLLLFFQQMCFAQLKVKRNGDVSIGQPTEPSVSKLTVKGSITADGLMLPSWQGNSVSSAHDADDTDFMSLLMGLDVISFTKETGEVDTLVEEHYSLGSESVSLLFPSLVSEASDGRTYINYSELIPLLLRGIQSLQKEVQRLKTKLASLDEKNSYNLSPKPYSAQLMQNTPNPVKGFTTIGYTLSGSFSNAFVIITDIYGNMLKSNPISGGEGQINVDCSLFAPGLYLYSLMVDNIVADSKKMIVIK